MRTHHLYRVAMIVALATIVDMSFAQSPQSDTPTDADLARLTTDKVALVDRLLTVIEQEIVPKTQRGVRGGSKLFGGAVLSKSDLSTVVAATNSETGNPLMHGEVTTIFTYYDIPRDQRPAAKDCIFVSTHEPCPLCLSSITWGGFDNFFYLFTYEDSKDAFGIPHDIRINQEIFRLPDAEYAHKNHYWSAWCIKDLIASCPEQDRKRFEARLSQLRKTYDEMSAIYQQTKDQGAEIPLP